MDITTLENIFQSYIATRKEQKKHKVQLDKIISNSTQISALMIDMQRDIDELKTQLSHEEDMQIAVDNGISGLALNKKDDTSIEPMVDNNDSSLRELMSAACGYQVGWA